MVLLFKQLVIAKVIGHCYFVNWGDVFAFRNQLFMYFYIENIYALNKTIENQPVS